MVAVAVIVAALVAGSALLGLVVLTAVGARKRGVRPSLALLSGLFFPIAWIAWYVQDGPGYQTSPSR